jgi:hypothetical protein
MTSGKGEPIEAAAMPGGDGEGGGAVKGTRGIWDAASVPRCQGARRLAYPSTDPPTHPPAQPPSHPATQPPSHPPPRH